MMRSLWLLLLLGSSDPSYSSILPDDFLETILRQEEKVTAATFDHKNHSRRNQQLHRDDRSISQLLGLGGNKKKDDRPKEDRKNYRKHVDESSPVTQEELDSLFREEYYYGSLTPKPTKKPTQRPRPTPRPTMKPRPTNRPTMAAPSRPTTRPTPRPTMATPRPTMRTTMGPTTRPTPRPTMQPTMAPSQPTPRPTMRPTMAPTRPTTAPTPRPPTPRVCDPPITPAQREVQLLEIVSTISTPASIATAGSPRNQAFLWLVNDDPAQVCPSDELDVIQRYVLALLYFATTGDAWFECNASSAPSPSPCPNNRGRWLSGETVCDWFGVICESEINTISILLVDNNLNGFIPFEVSSLEGLQTLDLSLNPLLTSTIPASLGDLEDFTNLILEENTITGSIPPRLFDARTIERLSLNFNQINGVIPANIGQLSQLDVVELEGNQIQGLIPENLPNSVRFFIVNGNNMIGPIPSGLSDNLNLRALALASNFINSTIPAFLGDLIQLETINLFDNELSGTIPSSLGALVNLENLFLHFNQLTGTMPQSICDLNLDQLTADCRPGGPVTCSCCTLCF